MEFIKKNLLIILLVSASVIVHFSFLAYPNEVVFDEVHFGKFINSYFTGEYYFDIHPPLGKMLIAGFAKICGYTSGFDFNHIGEMFDSKNLLILRFVPALFGALLPLVVYLTLRQLNISKKYALLGGILTIFDNALLIQSKFILVDSMLLFFGFLSIYLYLLSNSKKQVLFLSLSALSAGLSLSIKWTGVLFLGIIGLATIYKFIRKFNLKQAIIDFSILIFIPFIIYFLIFFIHLSLLPKSGSGDAYMSYKFQNTLIKTDGSEIEPMPFWQKFIELNKKMYFYNSSLSATHSYSSKWYQWPLGRRPIWYWSNATANIYFMGNTALWLAVLSSVAFSFYILFIKNLRNKMPPFFWLLLIGYFANLLPYIGVSRVTFLYHYLPSLVIGIIILSILLDKLIFQYINKKTYYGILLAIIAMFLVISPISYGIKMPEKMNTMYGNFVNLFLK